MRPTNKLSLITIFIFLVSSAGFVFADSTGMIFNWHPFIINEYLTLDHHWKNNFSSNLYISEEMLDQFEEIDELLHIDWKVMNNTQETMTKKSIPSKIKITISQVNSFMMPGDDAYLRGRDGKLSRATRILPSLLRNPSQETALETLKLIEPQINLGFEF
jgi:hypothetical protein